MTLATPTVLAKDTRFANGSDSSGVVIGIGSVVLIYYYVKCAFDTITISSNTENPNIKLTNI